MNTLNKFVVGVVAIGMVTTLVLPDRKTAQVAGKILNGTRGLLGTAMTGKTGAVGRIA